MLAQQQRTAGIALLQCFVALPIFPGMHDMWREVSTRPAPDSNGCCCCWEQKRASNGRACCSAAAQAEPRLSRVDACLSDRSRPVASVLLLRGVPRQRTGGGACGFRQWRTRCPVRSCLQPGRRSTSAGCAQAVGGCGP